MANIETMRENKELLESFLVERRIPENYQLPRYQIPFGYIYCIENLTNGKRYIGATYSTWTDVKNSRQYNPLRKRASNYIYEYNCAVRSTDSIKRITRPITQAMVNDGIKNFIMYPIAETTKENHSSLEKQLMDKFDTCNNGYNAMKSGNKGSKRGNVHTSEQKRLRSESIVAVNMSEKSIVYSESMKLFADHIRTTKDIIKNSARFPRPHKGWFIFYHSRIKQEEIISKIHEMRSNAVDRRLALSDKATSFYMDLLSSVNNFINIPNSELFPDFDFKELRYY
jgi:uncharacterized protein YdaT